MTVIHGLRHERAGQYDEAAVAFVAPFGFGGLEFPVLPGNGEPEDGAVVVGVDFESNHFQDDFTTFHLHLLDRRRQPADIAGLPVLCHQRPTGNALADRDFDLRMIPGPALIETAGESNVLVAGFLEVEEGLVVDFTNVDPDADEQVMLVSQNRLPNQILVTEESDSAWTHQRLVI